MKEISQISKDFNAYVIFGDLTDSAEIIKRELCQRLEGSMFDIVEPEDLSVVGLRSFVKKVSLCPKFGQSRIGLILGAENLSIDSQNTLLKVLEEPPKDAYIILVTTTGNLLPTILSRCRFVRVREDKMEVMDPTIILKLPIIDRFKLAEKMAQSPDACQVVRSWLRYFSSQLGECQTDNIRRGAALALELEAKLNSNANKRLLFENFFIELYDLFAA